MKFEVEICDKLTGCNTMRHIESRSWLEVVKLLEDGKCEIVYIERVNEWTSYEKLNGGNETYGDLYGS